MGIAIEQKILYKGPDQSELEVIKTNYNGLDLNHKTQNDNIATLDNVPASNLFTLLNQAGASKNPIFGLNNKDGLSIYVFQADQNNIFYSLGEINKGLYQLSIEAIIPEDYKEDISIENYFKISYAIDKEIIGSDYPQISKAHGIEGNEIRNLQKKKDASPDDVNDKTFVLKLDSKPTDFISSSFLKFGGFFVRNRVKEIINNQFNSNLEFFPTQFQHNNKLFEGYFWYIQESELIDFQNSIFEIKNQSNLKKEIPRENLKDKEALNKLIIDTMIEDINLKVVPRFLKLKEKRDFFRVSGINGFIVSESFRESLNKSDVSGLVTEPVDILIFT